MTEAAIRRRTTAHIKEWLGISLGLFHHYEARPLAALPHVEISPPTQADLKFSIVTPSYNQGHFIGETIKSVLTQDYPLFEYIVQDSCSTDETRDVLNSFKDERLHVFVEKDDGQSDAISRGFRRSSGDIMCYLNSDDLFLPQALQRVASIFATQPDVDAVYANRVVIDEKSRIVGDWRLPPHDRSVVRIIDYIPQETLFWRRRLWERVGGIDSTLQFAMDWDLILRFEAADARVVHIPQFWGAFRVHGEQKTQAAITTGRKEMKLVRNRYTSAIKRIILQVAHLRYLARHIQINHIPVKWQK